MGARYDAGVQKVGRAMEIPVVGVVIGWLLFPFVMLFLLSRVAAVLVGLSIFWTVPTVVWLSVLHDVPVGDAASYALWLADGGPEYLGPTGINTDPATVGFFIFTVIGWAILLAPLAAVGGGILFFLNRQENQRIDREIAESLARSGHTLSH